VALQQLEVARLRVALSGFGPLPSDYTIGSAPVGDQNPEAGTKVRRGSVVRLNMHGSAPLPSPAFLLHHPKFATIPPLIGKRWPEAERALTGGYWVQIGRLPALSPRDPADVLSSYVVTDQSPRAGTRVLYAGTKISSGYSLPILHLRIGVR
jgi:beta-lactam-binding protein with PASTA domain